MPAERHGGLRISILDKPHHAVEVMAVYHARPLVACKNVLAVVAVEAFVKLRYQIIRNAFVHKEIVGRHAGLSRIDALAPGDALRRALHVGVLMHDAGAFAAQLQHDRR